jgi:hypothetical protein
VNPHHFVAAGIDHFDCNPFVRTGRERQRDRTGELGKGIRIQRASKRFTQFLPCTLVREEQAVEKLRFYEQL